MPTVTKIKMVHKAKEFAMDQAGIDTLAESPEILAKFGVGFSDSFMKSQESSPFFALDAGVTQPVTTPSNGVPLQFLQSQLPGLINVLTKVRKADLVAPVAVGGAWHEEEVYLKTMEHTGSPMLYSDHGGLTLASFNETYESRQIIRFEMGVQSAKLSDERSAATGTNPMGEKRTALATAFEILRNNVAFNGFNVGTGKTYGILNDPNLPAYITVATGAASDTVWSTKTAAEKVSDIVTALDALNVQAGGNIEITSDPIDLEIPLSVQGELYRSDSSFSNGMTVKQWLNENFPNVEIVTVPQFDAADAGDNVFYLKAKKVTGAGEALGGQPMAQVVPAKMMALGSAQNAKGGVTEGYTSALAGVFVALPYAIVRYTGI